MKFSGLITRIILFALLVETLACGVKGPPLPPLETTPQASEVDRSSSKVRPSRNLPDLGDDESAAGLDPSDALTDTEGTLTQKAARRKVPTAKKAKKAKKTE